MSRSKSISVWSALCFTERSERHKRMTLRIDISDEHEKVVFTLIGRIQAEQVSELHALLRSEVRDLNFVLDLKYVKLVDRHAVRFLAQVEAQGAKLSNCSAFIRER